MDETRGYDQLSWSKESSFLGNIIKTAMVAYVIYGMTMLGIELPILPVLLWGLFFYTRLHDGQEISANLASGYRPPVTQFNVIPGPLDIMDGPLDKIYHLDVTWTLIILAVLAVLGWAIKRFKGSVGMLLVWGPICFINAFDFNVGKSRYYPGGADAYWHDHYKQVCQRTANGDILRKANGVYDCQYIQYKIPPF